jgi:Ca2+-binding RTX toxin-like protein
MIRAGSGNDVIRGDEGDDTIHAGAGDDHVEGGAGNDSILGGAGDDVIDGGDGDDTIDGGEGDDVLFGGAGNDRLSGGDGDDRIDGGDGDDVIEGGEGDDTIIDGAGSDRIVMDGGNDRVLNARDGARDVFVWADRDALARTPEWDTLSVFDTDHRTGDQLDLSGLGDGLVAELYGGGEGQNGLFAVYMSEGDRLAGNYMLAIEWVEQIGNGRILVSPSTQAKIKIGLGWSIIDVLGDPYA